MPKQVLLSKVLIRKDLCSHFFLSPEILYSKNYNLYPTFIIVYDNIDYGVLHAHVCYIVYNKNKKPKFFIWCDGIKNKIIVRPVEESIKKIKMYKKKYIKYSTGDIVEKYYTPDA